MIRTATVTAATSAGVWVQSSWLPGDTGPMLSVGKPAVGAPVLVFTTDDGAMVAVAADTNKVDKVTSTDNAVVRFDGTTGAVQDSTATLTDDGSIYLKSGTDSVRIQLDTDDSTTGSGSSLYLNTTTPASSHFGQVMWRVGGKNRWNIIRNRDAESSGDAGSNLEIGRYADNGSTRTVAVKLERSSGKVTLGTVSGTAGLEFSSGGPRIMSGAGSPLNNVTAPKGSLWLRTDGGTGTTLYVKESGTDATGWVAK